MSIFGFLSKINLFYSSANNASKTMGFFKKIINKRKDYIVGEQCKKIVIYRNGNGIIEHSFNFEIIKPENFKNFYRSLSIEDGCRNSCFPPLTSMLTTSQSERFIKYGFWFNSSDSFVKKVEEYYWDSTNVNKIDKISQANNKILKFRFDINSNKIAKGAIKNLTYSISVPDLYPIHNYKYDSTIANAKSNQFSTQLTVKYDILRIKYIIGFEKGFEFKQEPQCTLTKSNRNHSSKVRNISGTIKDNNFYSYYEFEIENLKYNDVIKIDWEFSE